MGLSFFFSKTATSFAELCEVFARGGGREERSCLVRRVASGLQRRLDVWVHLNLHFFRLGLVNNYALDDISYSYSRQASGDAHSPQRRGLTAGGRGRPRVDARRPPNSSCPRIPCRCCSKRRCGGCGLGERGERDVSELVSKSYSFDSSSTHRLTCSLFSQPGSGCLSWASQERPIFTFKVAVASSSRLSEALTACVSRKTDASSIYLPRPDPILSALGLSSDIRDHQLATMALKERQVQQLKSRISFLQSVYGTQHVQSTNC